MAIMSTPNITIRWNVVKITFTGGQVSFGYSSSPFTSEVKLPVSRKLSMYGRPMAK